MSEVVERPPVTNQLIEPDIDFYLVIGGLPDKNIKHEERGNNYKQELAR
jgi:hypothetical protein